MTFQEMAMHMFPYWIFGLWMIICTVQSGHKDVLKIDKKGVLAFLGFIVRITLFRIALFKFFPHAVDHMMGDARNMVNTIPVGGTLFVFWEDMAHTLPLVLMFTYLNDSLPSKILKYGVMAAVMFAFGMGHTYQGNIAAFALSFYIPYVVSLARKYGVGTIMVCHTIYDLTTLITIKTLLG